MLKFNNFPPQAAGDVQLSTEGKRALKSYIEEGNLALRSSRSDRRRDAEIELSNRLYYVGQALGHVIISSLEAPSKELALQLLKPLSDDYRDNVVIDPTEHSSFISGLGVGVEDALHWIERETEVRR